jgi:metal-sulfur cluster biosynthetic enzyme
MVCLDRKEEVWSALNAVTDPEIDESVVSLDFVTAVKIDSDNRVEIDFRLPTYWCAPNFAFLMASDMRDAVTVLEWVNEVSVKLLDHFSANLINRGVALRQDFRDAFPGETDDDLTAIRQKFLGKAFERRQELLLRYLLAHGYSPRLYCAGSPLRITRDAAGPGGSFPTKSLPLHFTQNQTRHWRRCAGVHHTGRHAIE